MMNKGKIKRINTTNFSGEIKAQDGKIVSFTKQALQGDPKQYVEDAEVSFEASFKNYQMTATVVTLLSAPRVESPKTTTSPASKPKPTTQPPKTSAEPKKTTPEQHTKTPYSFYKRHADKTNRHKPLQRTKPLTHSRLQDEHYDIAFEIQWQNLTPVAVNPCSAIDVPSSPIDQEGKDFAGYDKRWLMIDGKLAISPFTVKSAIANGFANLMGACYRVVSSIEKHPPKVEEGHYYYTGKYKRYRVAMDGSSKPGIIKKLEDNTDGSKNITIQPVKEYYYDNSDLPPFIKAQGDKGYIVSKRERGFKPPIIEKLADKGSAKDEVIYHGPYFDGMDAKNNHNKHKHRFYQKNGTPISGTITAENFYPPHKLKDIVYMGDYSKEGKGKIWYEDLNTLKVGDFVYYEAFGGRVTNIGKNFLFKALFSIDDAIPKEYRACDNPNSLCPRCSLFGMTGSGSGDEHGGYKGRFKASTLIGQSTLKTDTETIQIPVDTAGNRQKVTITTKRNDANQVICKQYLLPIQGQPKPNKRDVNGYYDKTTGEIKGAKYYLHARCDIDALVNETNALKKMPGSDLDYTHTLRNFAEVLTAPETFTGTVGAESCSTDEIVALILLLHSPLANYGFKIGIGKAFGMGTMMSLIKKVWIRGRDYQWQCFSSLEEFLQANQNIKSDIDTFRQIIHLTQTLQAEGDTFKVPDIRLQYPMPVQKTESGAKVYYWQAFNQS